MLTLIDLANPLLPEDCFTAELKRYLQVEQLKDIHARLLRMNMYPDRIMHIEKIIERLERITYEN